MELPPKLLLLILYTLTGVLLASLSIPLILRKIPPNSLYGFRVPKTLNNPTVWYEANAFAGVRLLVFSLVLITAATVLFVLPDLDLAGYAWSVLAVVVIGLSIVIWQSFRYLGKITS